MRKHPRGSEWGRWDLHVHTPDSLVQHYGAGGVDPWETFLLDLERLPAEFRVLGINDYLFLDGYRKIINYRKQGRIANIETVLPVVELRLAHFGGTDGHLSRLNSHVIFSDELDPDEIQGQFINGLTCEASLLPSGGTEVQWASIPTRESLTRLGVAVKQTLTAEQLTGTPSDLLTGFNNFKVTFENVIGRLQDPIFKNRHFLAVGKTEWADIKWTPQSIARKNER
jgi:hypothetical protein